MAHDSSGNNNNATLFGAAGWTTGLVGPFALSLPGFPIGFPPGSYAEIPGDVLDTTKSYTVAAWVKLNNVNGYQTFVSEDGDFQSAFFLQLRGDSHQFSFTILYDFFTLPESGFTPVVGVWYHLAGVYDSVAQTASLYVNGALADQIFNVGPRAASGNTRMPGGNYLEGNTIPERFQWKQTIGPIEQRPGHQGTWGYRSDDGLGLLEFLEWCEDLHMQPLLAVWAGYALNGTHVNPGADLAPYVQDALDEIQYVTGGTNTTWGAQRAADGHPAPFPLQYIEIGNEDFFDGSGSYDGRFAQFYDAIKAAYPNLKVIATDRIANPMRTPDLIDDHFYNTPRAMERTSNQYDNYSRTAPKIFVGEWASQEGRPTPDLNAALGDAAWLTGLERNSDVVLLEAYAPMLVNVNPGASQWPTNLIGYDSLHSYGSPSYYVQEMFSRHHGDVVLPMTLTTTGNGSQVYASVTRDSGTGAIYLKVVNAAGEVQPVSITIKGAGGLESTGEALILTSGSPQDTNTLSDPRNIVPETTTAHNLGQSFEYRFKPYSVTVLQINVGHEHHEPPGDGDDERD